MGKKTVIVEMYGDSTTLGAELLPDGSWAYPASASNVPAVLQSKYGPNVVVVNKGISGLTIPQAIIGAQPATKAWAQAMAESPADIVTLNFGINDAAQAWEDDFTVDYYIRQMIDVAQANGKTVVVETSNPVANHLYNRLSQIALVIRNVAQSKSLTLVDHHIWVQGLTDWNSKRYLPDMLHPSAELYNYKANNLYTIIDPVIQRALSG